VAVTWWSPEVVGAYVTEQLEADAEPGTNAQTGDPNAPAPTAENVISPIGTTASPPLASRTVTVQSDGAERVTGVPHETVVVDWRRPTAIVVVPAAAADPLSRASVAVIVWEPADPGPGVYATRHVVEVPSALQLDAPNAPSPLELHVTVWSPVGATTIDPMWDAVSTSTCPRAKSRRYAPEPTE
jgi:hypothetical protein